MKTAQVKFAAVLLTAVLLSPSAVAGGDGKPCFWKGDREAARTVAETPVPDEAAEVVEFAAPAIPDENAIVKLDENGEPILPVPESAE